MSKECPSYLSLRLLFDFKEMAKKYALMRHFINEVEEQSSPEVATEMLLTVHKNTRKSLLLADKMIEKLKAFKEESDKCL